MKRNKMKTLFVLMLAALMALSALGCAKTEEVKALKVGAMKGPTGMGLAYIMADTEKADTVELFDAPDAVSAKFISGELDVAAVPVNLASVLYNKTEGDTVVLAVNTLGVLYIAENGDSIQSMADLAGKTMHATGQGSTPEYVLSYLLEKNGLADVTVEYVGEHAALTQMMAAGEATIGMMPEPNVSAALAKGENLRVALNLTEEWNKVSDSQLVQGVYVARKANYEENKASIDAFMERVAASVEKVNSAEDAAAVVAGQGIVPSEGIAKNAIPRANIVCIRGEEMKAAVSGMLQVLFEANPKSVGGALPGDAFYAG